MGGWRPPSPTRPPQWPGGGGRCQNFQEPKLSECPRRGKKDHLGYPKIWHITNRTLALVISCDLRMDKHKRNIIGTYQRNLPNIVK